MAVAATKDATYIWEGKDKKGKKLSGQMLAPGEALVSAQLRRQGITVTKVRKQSALFAKTGKIREKDITLFTRQLAVMMKAGVPLLQAFDIVGRGAANPAVQRLLAEVKADIEKGNSMHVAFSKHPKHFDKLFVNLVEAGEAAGILEDVLDRLATYKEKILAIKGKIKSALFYPAAVLVVAFIVTAAIMIFVIPAFKELFTGFGADLPGPTLLVMKMSDFFVEYWYLIFGGIGAAIYGFMQLWKRSRKVQRIMDRLMLRLPIFGPVIEKATIARWTRTLSTMFAAGVPLVEALDSVGGAAGNQLYVEATEKIRAEVATGSSLTVAMQGTNRFPNMVLQMTSIGEESGALDSMLAKVADFYEREVDDAVEAISSLIEPMIMVVLGTLIGGLVIAMYLPIFKMGEAVGG
ncbi:type II secretion system F family protein [Betaproteobacteria bacterium SCN2]|jgi:type IV pilus assembly protein PilC|nr:type II secretion system F family protein [Betaproteobacteria bacterium SCN2]